MTTTKYGIVVGVTGAEENTAALRWAVEEAKRRDVRVTLAHAVSALFPPPSPSILLQPESLTEVGRQSLSGAAGEFLDMSERRLAFGEVLDHGHADSVLADLSKDADLVVTAHRDRHGLKRIRTHSTSISVAAHAHCPVVSVPEGWTADAAPDARWVTVGVHEFGGPEQVLAEGFAEADRRGAPLRVVHAWRLDPAYDDIITRRVDPEWHDRLQAELQTAVAPFVERYPDVEVDTVVWHQWPADAVADLAGSSSLVVVGRHGERHLLPHRVGSIARAAITTSSCPVLVVPV